MSLGSLALAIGWNVWKRQLNSRPAAKGVAVLPFENLTSDPDSAYFADGIQEDILARLANIADLKVISRTSTQHYQRKPRDRSSIAKQLGVAHILEGTVRKMADRVRFNVEQRPAADTAGAKATAEQARNTLNPLCRDQRDNSFFAQHLALANAAAGEKETALTEAERAIKLLPSARDPLSGPTREEVLALIQIMFGETSLPISTLTRLLQTPYISWVYGPISVTPALLRLDPMWDALRVDPRFQKLRDGKQP